MKQAASWPALPLASFKGLAADMAVMHHCHVNGCWESVDKYWQCHLLAAGLLVRRAGDGDWAFSTGPLEGTS